MFSGFKYYIHDTAEGYSLEMIGDLTETHLGELSCCWQTAKTTLKGRAVTLDLRNVKSIDGQAHQWVASMAQDGAACRPISFLLDTVAGLSLAKVPLQENTLQNLVGRFFRLSPRPAR